MPTCAHKPPKPAITCQWEGCGTELERRSGRGGRQAKWCDPHRIEKRRAQPKDSTTRKCSKDGCGRALRAKGLCSLHYNQQMPNRYVKSEYTCRICRKVVLKDKGREKRYTHTYCGYECMGKGMSLASSVVAVWTPRPALHTFIERMPMTTPPRTRTFKSGQCKMCAAWFLDLFGSSTCSNACQNERHADQKREHKQRRRARKRDAFVAPVYRTAIFERDAWTCQLCYRPIARTQVAPHPDAPTIDHVIPLAAGGTHEPSNVQAAHFLCNSLKGHREHAFGLVAC